MSSELPAPEGLVWWELLEPYTHQEVIDELELGARARWCWGLQWIYVPGVGWVDA